MGFADFIFSNAFIIMFLPVWVAFLITFNSTVPYFKSKHFTINFSLISTGICAIYSACLLWITSSTGMIINNDFINWISLNNSSYLSFGFLLDNLSALTLLIVTVISFLIQLYSYENMKQDNGFQRYYVYLNLFNFAISGLIISPNLFQTYMFSVLTGVFACLLYGFWHNKKSTSDAAKRIFLLNITGDCFILLGILFILYFKIGYFPESEESLLNFSSLYNLCQGIISYASDYGFFIICLAIISGLTIKSLLFPFFTNSDNTIEASGTSFSILSSVAFLIPGIYIIIRLLPIFSMSELAMKIIFCIGICFSFICALIAIFQKYIRKIISYCLCSQIGLIFASLSIFSTAAGVFHLTNTVFASALLFLAGAITAEYFNNCDDIRFMGRLRKFHPVIALLWITAVLSFTGLFFSGTFSKVLISGGFLSKGMLPEYTLILICTFLITFVLAKTYFSVFEGEKHYEIEDLKDKTMSYRTKISLSLIAAITALLGFFTFKVFGNLFDVSLKTEVSVKGILLFFLVNVSGVILAYVIFKNNVFGKKVSSPDLPKIHPYEILCRGLYFIERIITEAIIKFTGLTVKTAAYTFSKLQKANLQTQLLLSLTGIVLAFIFMLFYYYKLRGL